MSELISKIVEPMTVVTPGHDIDSTQNMLYLMNKFNDERVSCGDVVLNTMDSVGISSSDDDNKLNKRDGGWFYKTNEDHRKAVLEKIERLRNDTRKN